MTVTAPRPGPGHGSARPGSGSAGMPCFGSARSFGSKLTRTARSDVIMPASASARRRPACQGYRGMVAVVEQRGLGQTGAMSERLRSCVSSRL